MFSSFQWNSLNKTQAHRKANLLKNEDKPSRFFEKKKEEENSNKNINHYILFHCGIFTLIQRKFGVFYIFPHFFMLPLLLLNLDFIYIFLHQFCSSQASIFIMPGICKP